MDRVTKSSSVVCNDAYLESRQCEIVRPMLEFPLEAFKTGHRIGVNVECTCYKQ